MLKLILPVALTYLGLMLMGVVDLLFVGRLGPSATGAVGVGTAVFNWVMIFGIGLLAGLDYLVSFAVGNKTPEYGHRAWVQSILASTALSIPLTALLLLLSGHLEWLQINPVVRPEAAAYLKVLAWSLWPVLVFSSCRQYLTAQGVAAPALVILLGANIFNALANAAFVFGNWGFPAMGTVGSAVATLISRLAMVLVIGLYLWKWDRDRARMFQRIPFRFELPIMKEFLRLGLPSAFQMTLEVGVFALSTALAARFTADALAAHQIVLNIASLTFMVPMGVSSASSVLVGQEMGRGNPKEAARLGWRCLALGTGFMTVSALTLGLLPQPILSIFTNAESVLEIASKLMLIAALFQISDGIQVVMTGNLRGLGDTRSSMLANLGGHWLIGLPLSLLLGFHLGWGVTGLWIGLSSGLIAVAGVLFVVWWFRIREKTQSASS